MSVDGAAIDEKVPCRYVKSNPPKGQGLDWLVDRQPPRDRCFHRACR